MSYSSSKAGELSKTEGSKNRLRNEAEMSFRIYRYVSWVPIADLGWNAFADRGGRACLRAGA